ncbi:MAG: glycosyltransferase family 39 protein [Gemmataceae bacterium]
MADTPPTILGLFLAGFLLRAVLVLALRDVHAMPAGIKTADDVEFNVLGQQLARGEGFRNSDGRLTSFRAPGYPFFLAGVYSLAGEKPLAVYFAQCLLGGLTCVLAWALGTQLLDERGGQIVGWLTVTYVPHAWFATVFCSENLFTPLLALCTLIVLRAWSWSSPTYALLAGLVLGLAVLTRPFALLLVPLWGLFLLRSWRVQPLRALVMAGLLGVGTAAVVVPWMWRNYQVHQEIVLVATNGGSTFYGGNNPLVIEQWRYWGNWVSTTELPGRTEIEAAPTEVLHDRIEWRLGKEWVRDHPGHALATLPLKLTRFFVWLPDFDGGSWWYLILRIVTWVPYLGLLLVGLYLAGTRREGRRPEWMVVHLVLAASILTALVFWGSPRFRDANGPLLLMYPALALWSWRRADPGSDGGGNAA